jgi:hypothetical protein
VSTAQLIFPDGHTIAALQLAADASSVRGAVQRAAAGDFGATGSGTFFPATVLYAMVCR